MKLWRIGLLSLLTSLAWGQQINLGPPAVKGTLQSSNCPALTGDVTASANTCATTIAVKTLTINTSSPLAGGGSVALGGTLTITCTTCSTTTGTVTSIATTSPITGGTITTTGTIACATCVVASSPGVGIAHFAGSTQTVTSSAVDLSGADVTANLGVSHLNSGTGASSGTFWRGDGTWASAIGSAPVWNTITNPTGNLALSMGTDTSIFSGTAATAQFFAWKNTTPAIVGTSQGSPVNALCGRAFHGSADVEDCLTLGELPGNGNDATITYTLGHTGTSTGALSLIFTGTETLAVGSTTLPTINFNGNTNTGIYFNASDGAVRIDRAGVEMLGISNAGSGAGGIIANNARGYGWGTSMSNSDTGICRQNPGITEFSTSASSCNASGTYTGATGEVNDTGGVGSAMSHSASACETSFATTTLATGASTTDTGLSCLPINSIIDAVVYRITTTITTAANFTIGDATIAARFCGTQSTLTSGTTGICFVQADQTGTSGPRQTAAAKVRVTLNANPGAGAIRLIVYYHTWTAPTS